MTANAMRRAWDHRPVLGAWCTIGSSAAIELMADSGYDFLLVDAQHGEVGMANLEPMLRAFGDTDVTPVVRVPRGDYTTIGRALDAGGQAIIVPMVETREQAEEAARAVRYPPQGGRSWAVTRAARRLGSDPAAVNDEVALLVMVETAKGLRNIDEIAAVPGVDGIFVGPADLALTLGHDPGAKELDPEVDAALDVVAATCARHGLVAGLAGGIAYADRGFRVLMVASDRGLLGAGRETVVAAHARSEAADGSSPAMVSAPRTRAAP